MSAADSAPAAVRVRPRPATSNVDNQQRRGRSRIAWAIVATGAAALACGIVLLCAGVLAGRSAWQSVGLPITLLGQVALLLGMMLQLDLVWKGKSRNGQQALPLSKAARRPRGLGRGARPDLVRGPGASRRRTATDGRVENAARPAIAPTERPVWLASDRAALHSCHDDREGAQVSAAIPVAAYGFRPQVVRLATAVRPPSMRGNPTPE